MSLGLESIGIGAGGGGVVGFLIGYAAKKMVKLVLVLVGAALGGIAWLEHKGYIQGVDWQALNSDVSGFVQSFQSVAVDGVTTASSTINASGGAMGVGFMAGALLGLKKG